MQHVREENVEVYAELKFAEANFDRHLPSRCQTDKSFIVLILNGIFSRIAQRCVPLAKPEQSMGIKKKPHAEYSLKSAIGSSKSGANETLPLRHPKPLSALFCSGFKFMPPSGSMSALIKTAVTPCLIQFSGIGTCRVPSELGARTALKALIHVAYREMRCEWSANRVNLWPPPVQAECRPRVIVRIGVIQERSQSPLRDFALDLRIPLAGKLLLEPWRVFGLFFFCKPLV